MQMLQIPTQLEHGASVPTQVPSASLCYMSASSTLRLVLEMVMQSCSTFSEQPMQLEGL